MNFSLVENIEITTEKSFIKLISILQSGTTPRFQLLSDGIINGQIGHGKIKGVINPPSGWADPFKSNVSGNIVSDNDKTKIRLRIYPSWVILGFYAIWYCLLIFMIIKLDCGELIETIRFIGLIIIYGFIPYGLGKLKVTWDKKRLVEWFDNKINNSA